MDTLVLNTGYEPVAKVPWQRAITLLCEGKVEIVEEYTDKLVRSVTISFKMPAVVRFLRSFRPRKKAIKFSRENVYLRDGGKCQYCAIPVSRSEFTYDHVRPKVQGGGTSWDNVVVSCTPCNQKKSGRTPEQAHMKLLKAPIKPSKLPDTLRLTFTWQPGMPNVWKQWLHSVAYWHGELEQS